MNIALHLLMSLYQGRFLLLIPLLLGSQHLVRTTTSFRVSDLRSDGAQSGKASFGAPSIRPSLAASENYSTEDSLQPRKGTLYEIPVSNNGARCRLILYKKNLAHEIAVQPPSVLGGLQSDLYRSCNPEGKMPLFICNDSTEEDDLVNIFESDTIARYLLQEYRQVPPSFQPENPRSNLMARIHDMYLTTIQGCLYKAKPPFGPFYTRQDAIQEFVRQLHILANLMAPSATNDLYLCGSEVSLADATIFPTILFASHMLPKFDLAVPEKLQLWFERISVHDPDFAKVRQEMEQGLQVWESNRRWDGILGAGWRDIDPPTLFDQILSGAIPAAIVPQPDDAILAFRDIRPAAPAHILLIPKERSGLTRLNKATAEHTEILGRLLVAAATLSRDESLGFGNGCRIVINDGPDGGQEVMHLHVHLLGGRPMTWPPG
jgi:diadenosine tetraphosphate (Ap4A) HIT family hydrolase/glutathione S-transferase